MAAQTSGDATDGPRTLWMGDLNMWMDENYLLSIFAGSGEVLSVKVIRNKLTGYSEGYGFIEFTSNFAAQKVLQTYNGTPIPGTEQFFRLNWASHSSGSTSQQDGGDGSEHSIFVGDLSPDVTDYTLQEFFRTYYPSVKSARVVTDPLTGRPKGYGFVRFMNEQERDKAILEMSGQVLGSRAIRVSLATPKRGAAYNVGMTNNAGYQPQPKNVSYQPQPQMGMPFGVSPAYYYYAPYQYYSQEGAPPLNNEPPRVEDLNEDYMKHSITSYTTQQWFK